MRREQHTRQDSLHRNGEWLDGMMYALLARRVAQLALSCPQGARGRQRRGGRLVALVLAGALEPGAVEGLLLGVAGEHAEPDRAPVSRATRVSPSVAAEQT